MPAQPFSFRALAQKTLLGLDALFFPENVSCLCCQSALGGDDWLNLCPACRESLNQLFEKQEAEAILPPPGIEQAFAAFPYAGTAKTLILLLKYEQISSCWQIHCWQAQVLPSKQVACLFRKQTYLFRFLQ